MNYERLIQNLNGKLNASKSCMNAVLGDDEGEAYFRGRIDAFKDAIMIVNILKAKEANEPFPYIEKPTDEKTAKWLPAWDGLMCSACGNIIGIQTVNPSRCPRCKSKMA